MKSYREVFGIDQKTIAANVLRAFADSQIDPKHSSRWGSRRL
jgi:hypothetical protein